MSKAQIDDHGSALRNLPSVDEIVRTGVARSIAAVAGESHTADLARKAIDSVRQEIVQNKQNIDSRDAAAGLIEARLNGLWASEQLSGIRRVINATGVVIHTNLGRAPLSEAARKAVAEEAAAYCSLEYGLETGKRGKRGGRVEDLIVELTGAEAALVVNNCAAAAFFILNVFASGGEVIISRGEMVEIGGDFRVPDVLERSGASLCEVGTTNRTRLADYENAINERTRLILRVHPSNYRIVGFTAMPSLAELSALGRSKGILLYEDLGSGALIDLSSLGLADEPVAGSSIASGADLVSFSGDKLLGGPQSGIIIGKAEHIDRLRKHPLYRALRVDKLTLAALEATLDAYRRETATEEIPVLRMLSMTSAEIEARAKRLVRLFGEKQFDIQNLKFEILDGVSAVGGGAAPAVEPATALIAISHKTRSAPRLEHLLRSSQPPVIARIVNDRVMIDLRTVAESDEAELTAAIINAGK